MARKCHGKTKIPQQNTKPWQSKNHSNTKQRRQNEKSGQNKIAIPKQKSHGKIKKSRQN